MAEKKQFQSILDYRPQFENIIDTLVPDIEFSYTSIMNNTTIETYFNMLALEYYGFEYFQLLKLNNLEFKLNDRTLNLTILEMAYNIINQIIVRKWRYSEYIAYDMYILPIRIKKYISCMNYKFVESETSEKRHVFKLVSSPTKAVTQEIVDTYHDDRINNIIIRFRSCETFDIEAKLNLFKNLAVFLIEGKGVAYQKFGEKFGKDYFKRIDELMKTRSSDLSKKDFKDIAEDIDDLFNIGMLLILIMSDAIKKGTWDDIKTREKQRLILEFNQSQINKANEQIKAIKTISDSKNKKQIQLSTKSK